MAGKININMLGYLEQSATLFLSANYFSILFDKNHLIYTSQKFLPATYILLIFFKTKK